MRVTFVCVWCQRDGRAQAPDDASAIVGICSDHARRFLSEVDAALEGTGRRRSEDSTSAAPPTRPRRRRSASDAVGRRVADALARSPGTDLCDRCLAADARCSPGEAESAATTLSGLPDFLRDEWRCARCGARAIVTRVRPRRTDGRGSSSVA
ncbi:MAG: hypothetical protein DMD91_24040 [Candidatus Rokuibacteriota bacterium]|nr:MAG: hypothetical protein DMD91_24040 [Candidatus Rokubacteria bacterium]